SRHCQFFLSVAVMRRLLRAWRPVKTTASVSPALSSCSLGFLVVNLHHNDHKGATKTLKAHLPGRPLLRPERAAARAGRPKSLRDRNLGDDRQIVPWVFRVRRRFHPHQIAVVEHPSVAADRSVI